MNLFFLPQKKKSSNSLHKVYVQARIEMFEKIFLYKRIFKIFKQYFLPFKQIPICIVSPTR